MSRSFSILFLDDNELVHSTLGIFTEKNKYPFKFDRALCPTEAFRQVVNNEYDCIITDFNMPGLNGKQFLNAIYSLEKNLPPILGFTAEKDPGRAFGNHPLVKKVFSKDQMKECLDYILDHVYNGVIQ